MDVKDELCPHLTGDTSCSVCCELWKLREENARLVALLAPPMFGDGLPRDRIVPFGDISAAHELRQEIVRLREALNDVLADWLNCDDPSARRAQLRGILLNESPWPLEDLATSILFIRSQPYA